MGRGPVRWTQDPTGLRGGQARVRVDNFALVPASLLPYKAQYQKLANQLPPGAVLVVLPTGAEASSERQVLQQAAARFRDKGHPVTILFAEDILALTGRRRRTPAPADMLAPAPLASETAAAAPPVDVPTPPPALAEAPTPTPSPVPLVAVPPVAVPPFTHELRLVSIDGSRNRARFYVLQWHPTLWDGMALVRVWGRIGSRGQAKVLLHAEEPEVNPTVERLVRRRLQRGYQLVDWQ